ncbi:DUF3500 domain-containing protein [Nocardioides sp. Kera G14]|uniref:DUF3500 domain-containing protein n=1 Tax=Nocardioides sp. Kera G14 TaxID=2884264 RepID=UPI001D10867D|nr:DUF3500 domain-containing protein [Nocardioides sp. Kera G14]UDY23414.1 DUF3500 domain-containing protein [Nocardioides sp. Kera G14]
MTTSISSTEAGGSAETGSGFRVRPKGFYPFIDGHLHPELLGPVAAYELTAAERNYLDPYIGVTADGTPQQGLYTLAETGIPVSMAEEAARTYLATLRPHFRTVSSHPMDSPNWRRWTNAFTSWVPKGVQLARLSEKERDAALALIEASLSPEGYRTVRDAMRLNGALGEIVDDYAETLTEFTYWMTIFGEPSTDAPWGWQLMGHHLDLNFVFVGTQVVLAPVFVGAEPSFSEQGTYAGTRLFEWETGRALALRRTFTDAQADKAVLFPSILNADLPEELSGPFNGRHLAGAGQDNRVIPYEGVNASELSGAQQDQLLELVELYVRRLPEGHARLKMEQVQRHLDDTHVAWMGGHDDVSAFYYRIHSPVLLVEYDSHPGIFLDYDEPMRDHIHTIVREPNGNDYGKSLLAQHYALRHS